MSDTDNSNALHEARVRVANRYSHGYHKNAIMQGDWDSGCLVRDALAEVISERKEQLKKEGTIQEDE